MEAGAPSTTTNIQLFAEMQILVDAITPEQYVNSGVGAPSGDRILGPATDEIKRLYAFWHLSEIELTRIEMLVRLNQRVLNQEVAPFENIAARGVLMKIGHKTDLLKRAAHVAIGFEVGTHFKTWGIQFGIDKDWNVYTPMV